MTMRTEIVTINYICLCIYESIPFFAENRINKKENNWHSQEKKFSFEL